MLVEKHPVTVLSLLHPAVTRGLDSWRGGEIQLLGLSAGGQLRRITMRSRAEDADLSRGPTVQVGRGVRDHLSAIGDVCERYSNTTPL